MHDVHDVYPIGGFKSTLRVFMEKINIVVFRVSRKDVRHLTLKKYTKNNV